MAYALSLADNVGDIANAMESLCLAAGLDGLPEDEDGDLDRAAIVAMGGRSQHEVRDLFTKAPTT